MATTLERRKQIEKEQAAKHAQYHQKSTAVRRAEAKAYAAAKRAQKQEREAAERAKFQQAEKQVNGLARGAATLGRVLVSKPTEGVLSGLEGGVDLALGLVGGAGGLFSETFRNGVQDVIAYNATEEWVGRHLDELTKYSYTEGNKVGEIAENVAHGVGQMLPAVAVTVATGGTGAPAAIGMAVTAVNAAGNAAQNAYKDGAEYYQGLAYGAASGAMEAATEKLVGGVGNKLTGAGKGLVDNALKNVAKTGAARIAKEAVGEGVEEMISEAADPALKTIYQGTDALAEYKEPALWGQVAEAGLVGGLTSVVFGQTVGRATGGNADLDASLNAIGELERDASLLHTKGELTEETYRRLQVTARQNLKRMEKTLQRTSDARRADLIRRYALEEAFDASGRLRPSYAPEGVAVAEGAFSVYQSPALTGEADRVRTGLARLTNALRQEQKNSGETENFPAVRRFEGSLSESEQRAYRQFKQAVLSLNRRQKQPFRYVLVQGGTDFYGARVGDILFLSADTLRDGSWFRTLVHETTHLSEGTEAYRRYVRFLARDAGLSERAAETVTEEKTGYGLDRETAQNAAAKAEQEEQSPSSAEASVHAVQWKKTGSAEEDSAYAASNASEPLREEQTFLSEWRAHMSEELLGEDKEFAQRLVRGNVTLAEKVLNFLSEAKRALKNAKSTEERQRYQRLRRAEKMYLEAVTEAGMTYRNGKIRQEPSDRQFSRRSAQTDSEQKRTQTEFQASGIQVPLGGTEFGFTNRIAQTDENVNTDVQFSRKILPESERERMRRTYEAELAAWNRAGRPQGETFILGMTGNVLQGLGAIESDIYMQGDKINTILQEHAEMTLEEIKKIPQILEDPVLILKSRNVGRGKSRNTRLVIFGSVKASNGYPVLSVFDLKPIEQGFALEDMQKINSAYTKDQNVVAFLERSDVLYADKKRSRSLLNAMGMPTPVSLLHGGFMGSISYVGQEIHIDGKPFSEVFQPEAKAASLPRTVGFQIPIELNESGFTDSISQTDSKYNPKRKKFLKNFQSEAKATSLLRSTGFQIPAELNDSGFTDSISQTDSKYNPQRETFSKKSQIEESERSEGADASDGSAESVGSAEAEEPILQFSRKPSAQTVIKSQERKLERRDGRIARQKAALAEQKALIREQEKQLRRRERGAERADLTQSQHKIAEDARRLLSLQANGYVREAEGGNAESFEAAWRTLAESGSRQDPAEVRSRLKTLGEWYTSPANRRYHDRQGTPNETFKADIAARLARIGGGEGKLSTEEWRALAAVTGYFHAEVAHRNQVFVRGQWQEAAQEAERFLQVHQNASKGKSGLLSSLGRSGYVRTFGDPFSVMRAADRYDPDGLFTQTFQRMEEGECGARIAAMEITAARQAFLKADKRYIKRLTEETVTYGGRSLRVEEGLYLYLLHKRRDTWQTLARTGVAVDGKKGDRILLPPLDPRRQQVYSDRAEELQPLIRASAQALEEQFTEADRQFLQLAEEEMRQCSALKEKTDLLLDGYTNVKEDYYIPTYRTGNAVKLSEVGYGGEVNRITDPGFNESVSGSAERLLLRPLSNVLDRHVSGMSLYANLSLPIQNFNRTLYADLAERGAPPKSLYSELAMSGQDKNALRFLQQLVRDLEGKGESGNQVFDRFIRRLRSNYATAVLGVNPGTLLSQTSSYLAAGNLLQYRSLVRGFTQGAAGADVDRYCPLAKLRNTERTAVKARSVTDSVSRVGEAMMKGISVTDRLIVRRLFAACKAEVQSRDGLAFGSEANDRAAGRLLTQILLRTQQNSLTTGRSEAMRSPQELLRSVTMFTSDAMKQNGRFLDAAGALSADRARLNDPDLTPQERAALQSRVRQDAGQFARSGATLLVTSAYLAALSLLVRGLYGRLRDREPEEIARDLAVDAIGNTLGGLPLIRDLYDLFTEGYELDTFSVSMVNDVLNASKSVLDLCGDAFSGKSVSSRQTAAAMRRLTYGVSHLFGIPARNVYRVTAGITGAVSPAAGYRLESLFEKKHYRADLKRALEEGDESMIAAVAERMLAEEGGGERAAVRSVQLRLAEQGYTDIFPRHIGDTVTVRGQTLSLGTGQKQRFRAVYRQADEGAERLVSLPAYRQADAALQAKTLRSLYDLFDRIAREEVLGEGDGALALFVRAVGAEQLALAVCTAREIQADTDAFGKAVAGSRKAKIIRYLESLRLSAAQKHMLLGYLGYRQSEGRAEVERYLNTFRLSTAEKQALLALGGYAA